MGILLGTYTTHNRRCPPWWHLTYHHSSVDNFDWNGESRCFGRLAFDIYYFAAISMPLLRVLLLLPQECEKTYTYHPYAIGETSPTSQAETFLKRRANSKEEDSSSKR